MHQWRKWVCVLLGSGITLLPLGAAGAAPALKAPHPAVAELAQRGVLKGYPDGKYAPNKPVTRLELAVIAARLLRALEANPSAAQRAAKPSQSAAVIPNGVPPWAREEFRFLTQRGYPQALPALCRELRRPAREQDVVAVLQWSLTSLAQRGYLPPGELAPAPAEP